MNAHKAAPNQPAVIAALLQEIKQANPHMPGVRGLNKIAEATSAALVDAGLLSLPARKEGGKQPKATNVDELLEITDAHLGRIVQKWERIEHVRSCLLGKPKSLKSTEADAPDLIALCAAVTRALQHRTLSNDDLTCIRALASDIRDFLAKSVPTL